VVNFLGNRTPAHDVAPFEYQRRESRLRQIGGSGQPVVTRPDDDSIEPHVVGIL
jgi:hypothetical protein